MKSRILITFFCFIAAFSLMSGGYGQWEKRLIIRGDITVVDPTPIPTPIPTPTLTPTPTPTITPGDVELLPSPTADVNPIGEIISPETGLEDVESENLAPESDNLVVEEDIEVPSTPLNDSSQQDITENIIIEPVDTPEEDTGEAIEVELNNGEPAETDQDSQSENQAGAETDEEQEERQDESDTIEGNDINEGTEEADNENQDDTSSSENVDSEEIDETDDGGPGADDGNAGE